MLRPCRVCGKPADVTKAFAKRIDAGLDRAVHIRCAMGTGGGVVFGSAKRKAGGE